MTLPSGVSVIIPAYNPSETIREAIDSALGQTMPPQEVIVVDDGSTKELSWLAQAYAGRIRILRKENGGPASARNEGIRCSKGAWIAFLDADDIWEPDKLEQQIRLMQQHPEAGLAYGPVRRMDAEGNLEPGGVSTAGRSGMVARELFWSNFVPTSTVLARRSCLESVGLFDESPELISVEDYDLWLRVAERFSLVGARRPLARYRRHPEGISRNVDRSYTGERRVIERALSRSALEPAISSGAARKRFARIEFDRGIDYFTMHDLIQARKALGRSLKGAPFSLRAWIYWAATWMGVSAIGGIRHARAKRRKSDERLRLVHVLFTVETGGAEHVVLNLIQKMDQKKYALSVISLTGRGSLAEAFERSGVRVVTMGKREGVDPVLWWRLFRWLRRERIDIVHTHNVTPWLYAGPAARLAGARIFHTEHSNLFPHQHWLKRAERTLALWTERIIGDSEKVSRQLIKGQNLPARRVVTIPNGINVNRFKPADALSRNGTKVIGTVGRLVPVKNQILLLSAFRKVRQSLAQVKLILIGDGPLRRDLEAAAAELGVADGVEFLGDRKDVEALLLGMDVFVLCSKSEGLPLTVLEAMAAGRPVVATRVGGLPEAVEDQVTGSLVPPDDADALAEALLNILGDADLAQRMGTAGRKRAVERFSLDQMAQSYENCYEDTLRH